MKIGILGSGGVAQTLAAGFLKHGHDVMLGTRETAKLAGWLAQHPRAQVGGNAQAAQFGDVVVLAAKGSAAASALRLAGAVNLMAKPVIDATNPIADEAPVNGVLRFFTGPNDSLMEQLQREFPQARLVKAFNSVGAGQMVNPTLAGGPPTMFICGNDTEAKQMVAVLLTQFGWETWDMGKAEAARAIEPLCMLWCIPGVAAGDWSPRAFKMLRGA
ncbi:MAG TPA: NAD(P)-binding domain-containing protein [Solimonas sp.]|nr:NAD(P)-binding domain-containing protein [Solimonas sp.]